MLGTRTLKRAILGLFVVSARFWNVAVASEIARKPTSLKDALNFMSALYNNQPLQTHVARHLEKNAIFFFQEWAIYTVNNCFYYTLKYADLVRNHIVRDPEKYEDYGAVFVSNNGADVYAKYIINLLPRVFSTLNYLYFELDSGWERFWGGQWNMNRCDGEGEYPVLRFDSSEDRFRAVPCGTDLHKWLTDQHPFAFTGIGSSKESANPEARILPAGYKIEELSNNYLAEALGSLKGLVYYTSYGNGYGYMQYLLLYLFFDYPTFNGANTGLSLAFLSGFCKAVADGTFDSQIRRYNGDYKNLKVICVGLLPKLKAVASEWNGQTGVYLMALFGGSGNDYKQLLQAGRFDAYAEQLKRIINPLVASLKLMREDAPMWNGDDLIGGTVAGPYAYGFAFNDQWKTSEWTASEFPGLQHDLPEVINKLIGDDAQSTGTLQALEQCLKGFTRLTYPRQMGVA